MKDQEITRLYDVAKTMNEFKNEYLLFSLLVK